MKLLVISDLHLELVPSWTMPASFPPFDVAIFAGDIERSPTRSVAYLAGSPGLAGKPVIFVPGNHEFYRSASIDDALAIADVPPVHMLDRKSIVIDGVRFIGAILWTDYELHGNRRGDMMRCARGLNDHRLIGNFGPDDALARHGADRAFLVSKLAEPFNGPTVVVTHHAPHPKSVHSRFKNDPITAGFVSDLSSIIKRGRPALWVHGHTHSSFDYVAGKTRVICNPKGYGPRWETSKIENPEFDPSLVIEI